MKTIIPITYFLNLFLALFLLGNLTSLQAQVNVAGAGEPGVDGSYPASGTFNTRPYYSQGAFFIYWDNGLAEWHINDNLGDDGTILYYTTTNTATPPTTGWVIDFGAPPAPSVILPVEIIAFEAFQADEGISLRWQTASELNNNYFTLERSLDNDNWNEITQIDGHGTTSESQAYSFEDKTPHFGNNYYRLKQVDFGGEYAYSRILELSFSPNDQAVFQLYPNPVSRVVHLNIVSGADEFKSLKLYDSQGRLHVTKKVTNGLKQIDTGHLPQGLYFIHLIQKDGKRQVEKFVKQ